MFIAMNVFTLYLDATGPEMTETVEDEEEEEEEEEKEEEEEDISTPSPDEELSTGNVCFVTLGHHRLKKGTFPRKEKL